ncbi:MAG TPA: DUF480 domain-containing protein [Lacipirellulaceae bacterium]
MNNQPVSRQHTYCMTTEQQTTEQPSAPRWRPISAIERRVVGVLVEKAKTTPENYPLSLNAIRAGCNQKSNRAPLMQLEEDQIDEALEQLRKIGAVAQIQGGARIDRYRHLAYDWLGVEKVELAVMAELLLRGTQTVGELRGRAARMEPIKDLAELQPTLDSLHAKGLVHYLTPPGRGIIVTHALYLEQEKEKVRREAGLQASTGEVTEDFGGPGTRQMPVAGRPDRAATERLQIQSRAEPSVAQPPSRVAVDENSLAADLRRLQEELSELKQQLLGARSEFENTAQDLRHEIDDLNRQLGN